MHILSIDPGTEKVGAAVFSYDLKPKYITSHLIKTSRSENPEIRLLTIFNSLSELCNTYEPDIIVCEKIFLFKNQKTIVSVAQAQGAIMLLAAQRNIPIEFLTPLEIKQTITGYGTADKKSVHKMLKLTLGEELVVADDDESDAIAAGLAYCYLKRPKVQ